MYNGRVDIDGCILGKNKILFFLNGIVGFIACYCFANLLRRKSGILSAFGKVSLTILGTHMFFCIFGKTIGVTLLNNLGVEGFPFWVSVVIASTACSFAVIIKQSKYFNWLP